MSDTLKHIERYAVTAYLRDPVSGRSSVATRRDDPNPVLARTPLAAARIWYWRLNQPERMACVCIVTAACPDPAGAAFPSYRGPEMAFSPIGGWCAVEPALMMGEVD